MNLVFYQVLIFIIITSFEIERYWLFCPNFEPCTVLASAEMSDAIYYMYAKQKCHNTQDGIDIIEEQEICQNIGKSPCN